MKAVPELVQLPDPAVQPLVHPLDLPEARRALRRWWSIVTLCHPVVGLCLAVIVWMAAGSYLLPLLAAAVHIGAGILASRHFRREAWAFIPRGRQDRERPLPVAWDLGSAFVFAGALTATVLLLAVRLDQPDVPGGVREFVFGAAIATAVLIVGDLIRKLLVLRGRDRRRAGFTVPGVLAVVGSVAVARGILFGPSAGWMTAVFLLGAGAMLAVGAGIGVWKGIEVRRGPRASGPA